MLKHSDTLHSEESNENTDTETPDLESSATNLEPSGQVYMLKHLKELHTGEHTEKRDTETPNVDISYNNLCCTV